VQKGDPKVKQWRIAGLFFKKIHLYDLFGRGRANIMKASSVAIYLIEWRSLSS